MHIEKEKVAKHQSLTCPKRDRNKNQIEHQNKRKIKDSRGTKTRNYVYFAFLSLFFSSFPPI